ncbi:MAG: hypothetical protein NZV14_18105 [Bryobacteraceae bacterium]|nr:hypothetical protein [Bryobacteraceae bacterium]MDW8380079.1 hypothetical protein [Bryobacterales bacterium]
MILWFTILCFLEATLHGPHLGDLPGSDGQIRPLYGVKGNFLWGKPWPLRYQSFPTKTRRSIAREDGRSWLVEVHDKGETLRTALPAARLWALDSNDQLWWAEDRRLGCPAREWNTPAQIQVLFPLRDGWMAVRTREGDYLARCDEPELYLLPRPE